MTKLKIVAVVLGLMWIAWTVVAYAQGPRPNVSSVPGRFQVVVDGRINTGYDAFLIDTVTGETWSVCVEKADDGSGAVSWCGVPRIAGSHATIPAPRKQ